MNHKREKNAIFVFLEWTEFPYMVISRCLHFSKKKDIILYVFMVELNSTVHLGILHFLYPFLC